MEDYFNKIDKVFITFIKIAITLFAIVLTIHQLGL